MSDKRLRFLIPSDYPSARQVQQQIAQEMLKLGYGEHSLFATKLAMEEAMVNAIKHGNRLDPAKHVRVEARLNPHKVCIVVEDEGPGFCRQSVPDPREDQNLEKCCGRGILLMESYMNQVQYSHGGRRVKMVKCNDPDLYPRIAK